MRNTILIIAISISFLACKQEMRYTQSSAEIDATKAVIAAYEAQDWEALKAPYADTAKVYHNTDTEAMSIDEVIASHKEAIAMYASYGFVKDKGDLEMVVTDKGETWVNYWGLWKGTMGASGNEIEVPVHLTSQWVDGKVVKEYGYWNMGEIMLDIMESQAEEAGEEEMPAEE